MTIKQRVAWHSRRPPSAGFRQTTRGVYVEHTQTHKGRLPLSVGSINYSPSKVNNNTLHSCLRLATANTREYDRANSCFLWIASASFPQVQYTCLRTHADCTIQQTCLKEQTNTECNYTPFNRQITDRFSIYCHHSNTFVFRVEIFTVGTRLLSIFR